MSTENATSEATMNCGIDGCGFEAMGVLPCDLMWDGTMAQTRIAMCNAHRDLLQVPIEMLEPISVAPNLKSGRPLSE